MNKYQRAATLWVARKHGIDWGDIKSVDFSVEHGYYDYTEAGLLVTFHSPQQDPHCPWKTNTYREFSLEDIKPGQFIEECVALLPEVDGEDS